MGTVRFEDTALADHGTGLAGCTTAAVIPTCWAPGADPVSVSAVGALTAHAQALAAAVDYSSAVRAHGGGAVAATAATLAGVDAGNAAAIRAVAGGAPPAGGVPTLSAASMPLPTLPALPPLPTVPAPPLLPGEQWSALIHGGPGSAGLRAFAEALRAQAGGLDETAGRVAGHGRGVDEHWVDGIQQAGANIERHGNWLNGAAVHANALAAAADHVADAFDDARAAVPPPDEFARARRDILSAQAAGDPVALSVAAQHYSGLQTQALDGVLAGYHPSTTSTLGGLPHPLSPAPSIAPGADADTRPASAGPDDVIVGPDRPGDVRAVPVDHTTGPGPVVNTPGGQPQIGPFPVPPQVAAAVPPDATPRLVDPTGGLLTPQDLPPATSPPRMPGVNPPFVGSPAVPSTSVPSAPPPPGCGLEDWTKGVAEAVGGPVAILTTPVEAATGVGVPAAIAQIGLGLAATIDGVQIIERCTE
ncbi:PPE domain-containing protein [Mycolicibacterium arenosum]|uniref:PPE domain-containing protein n=1 Tax=Mycolicibacterium arenosum TaxID=2952157 RepID=A0ABT1MCP2_9MYCO|nr:PPE domain-containing protein [Mycolicibacterium sp. CAU 1645]MCP9276938.1 PPE domain-containing protein [Mycolicibacterium sp. CAU 1645]